MFLCILSCVHLRPSADHLVHDVGLLYYTASHDHIIPPRRSGNISDETGSLKPLVDDL